MLSERPPCRLALYLSRKVPVGVILRRGPAKWVQLVHWDRKTDTFTPGQWFHGRIYERRCDLSPDGSRFLYFAGKFGPRRSDTDNIGECWTAISRPPYFTALALWPNLGAWYGGGVFKTDRLIQLDACASAPHPRFGAGAVKVEPMRASTSPWEQRLLRDGWSLVERGFDPRTFRRVGAREIWRKNHPHEPVSLFREAEEPDFGRNGDPYTDLFWLEADGDLVPLGRVSYADWDTWERLVLVRDGKLFAAGIAAGGLVETELHDFNQHMPRRLATPDWAKRC